MKVVEFSVRHFLSRKETSSCGLLTHTFHIQYPGNTEALSRSTNNVLKTLDRKISEVKEKVRAYTKMLENHDKAFNDNLKEVYAKSKEQQTTSNDIQIGYWM